MPNVSGAGGDHDSLRSSSSKVRSDGKEYSSYNDAWGKGRYQDLLDFVQEEMGPSIGSEFVEVCRKI